MNERTIEVEAKWLLLAEVEAEFRVPAATLYAWRQRGVGPPSVRIGRRIMYRRTEIEAWFAEQERAEAARRSHTSSETAPAA